MVVEMVVAEVAAAADSVVAEVAVAVAAGVVEIVAVTVVAVEPMAPSAAAVFVFGGTQTVGGVLTEVVF